MFEKLFVKVFSCFAIACYAAGLFMLDLWNLTDRGLFLILGIVLMTGPTFVGVLILMSAVDSIFKKEGDE